MPRSLSSAGSFLTSFAMKSSGSGLAKGPRKRGGAAKSRAPFFLSSSRSRFYQQHLMPPSNPFADPLQSSTAASGGAPFASSSGSASNSRAHLRQRSLTARTDSLPQSDLGHDMTLTMGGPGAFVSCRRWSRSRRARARVNAWTFHPPAHAPRRWTFLEGFITVRRSRRVVVQFAFALRRQRSGIGTIGEQVRTFAGRRGVRRGAREGWARQGGR